VFGGLPLKVISFVMSRKMMLEIKRLAERDAAGDLADRPRGAIESSPDRP